MNTNSCPANIFQSLILCVCIAFSGISTAESRADTEPVKRLKQLYATEPAFRKNLDMAFANVRDPQNGSVNPWRGKRIEDLYAFFNEWFYFVPNIDDGMDYIMRFSWLYYRNPHGLKVVREEPGLSWTRYFVEQRGQYMDSEASAGAVAPWLADPATHIDEFIVPEAGFASFTQFFIRDLKPGARPIDSVTDPSVVVSPADCVVNMINNDLRGDSRIPLKGRMTLNVKQLLGASRYAERFVGGTAMACFLLPNTYHHYHAPISGVMVESRQDIGKQYFGIDDLPGMVNRGNPGYNRDFSVFEQFRHGYFIIESAGNYGHVAVVPVGLSTVGSVVFEEKFNDVKTPTQVSKGEKLGHFAYGGSLVIMLFEKKRLSAVKTRLGQQIGLFNQ